MRYPNCQKIQAFKLFDQGKRPAEIYDLVKVKKHTLFNYYQLWKKEQQKQQKENNRRIMAARRQERVAWRKEEKIRKVREQESVRIQERIRLEAEYKNQKKRILELELQMSRAADKPDNNEEIMRIGEVHGQAYDRFKDLTRQLYPQQADDKSIEMALHPK
jgi:hypothetical protein